MSTTNGRKPQNTPKVEAPLLGTQTVHHALGGPLDAFDGPLDVALGGRFLGVGSTLLAMSKYGFLCLVRVLQNIERRKGYSVTSLSGLHPINCENRKLIARTERGKLLLKGVQ